MNIIPLHPTTSPPRMSLDKISIGLPMEALPVSRRSVLGRNLTDIVDERGARPQTLKGKAFKRRYLIPLIENTSVLIEFHPNNTRKAKYGLRLECNPNKLGLVGCRELQLLLRELFGHEAKDLFFQLRILSADWCLDFQGMSVRDVSVHAKEKYTASTWGKQYGTDAEMETLYVGSPTSAHQIRAYDKARELLSALVKANPKLVISDLKAEADRLGNWMRLESCMKDINVSLSELEKIQNPFKGIELYSIPQLEDELNTDVGRLFIDSVRLMGLNIALHRIHDKNLRRRLARAVAKHRLDWWQPEQFGTQVMAAVKSTGIFPESAFVPTSTIRALTANKISVAVSADLKTGELSTMRRLPMQSNVKGTSPTQLRRR